MRYSTKVVIDIESGEIISRDRHEYQGPVIRCDRAAQQQSQQAEGLAKQQQTQALGVQQNAQNASTGFAKNASGILGTPGTPGTPGTSGTPGTGLAGFGEGMMTAPPGYGAALPGMEATAGEVGSEAAANQQETANLRSAATGNTAGLGANEDAIAESAAQGTGANIQDILAQNAQLQNQQQQEGAGVLSGIYGENVQGQLGALGQETGAVNAGTGAVNADVSGVNAQTNAGKSGWLQNMTGILGTVRQR